MNCLVCGLDNPATVTFCKKCGAKLDLTADEIQAALVEKQKVEKKKVAEYWVHNGLLLSAALFLLSITLFIMSGGMPQKTYNVPSAAREATYIEIQPDFDAMKYMQPVLYPLPPQR